MAERVVSLESLDVLRAAISSAHNQNQVLDIADQYRKLSQRPQPSAFTKSLRGALDLILEIMEEPIEEFVEEPVSE